MEYNRTMKPQDNETPIEVRVEILSDLWLNFRNDENFADFIEYNDLGLPLAYAIASNIVVVTDKAENFINETFLLLLASLGIEFDTGFADLDEILGIAEE